MKPLPSFVATADGAKLSRDLGIDCKGCFDLNALRKPDPESVRPLSSSPLARVRVRG